MEINRKGTNKLRNYGDIPVGTVFEFQQNIYMKTNIPEDGDSCSDMYSVSLSTGKYFPVGNLVHVKVLKAELTVEEEDYL